VRRGTTIALVALLAAILLANLIVFVKLS